MLTDAVVAGLICLDIIPRFPGPATLAPGKVTEIGAADLATGGAVLTPAWPCTCLADWADRELWSPCFEPQPLVGTTGAGDATAEPDWGS